MRDCPVMKWILLVTLTTWSSAAHGDQLPQPPPPSDNAAVWYLTAQYYFMSSGNEEKHALLEKYRDPDLEEARKYLAQSDALAMLRRGAALERCAWAVDLKADGPYALLPHLGMMRELSRLMAVSGRVRLEDGDAEAALGDWVVMMHMARHSADDGTLIGCLVQHVIDRTAIELLADHLHRLDRDGLEVLSQLLADIPTRYTVQDAVAAETMMGSWLRRQYDAGEFAGFQGLVGDDAADLFKGVKPEQRDEKMKQWLDELDAAYGGIYDLLGLENAAFVKANAQYERDIAELDNPLIRLLMPAIGSTRAAERRALALHAMLRAMIAYRLGGEEAFNAVVDPLDGKPFDRKLTEKGLVVSSRIKHRDKPLFLIFAAEAGQSQD